MRAVRVTFEILSILLIAWAALASSEDGGGGGGADPGNGGGSGTPQACTVAADCGGGGGDLCSVRYECVGGLCVPKDPPNCNGLPGQDACTVGSCEPTTGRCVLTPVGDGTWCDDGNPCTTGEQCAAGRCAGGQACNDGNACTVDTCDAVNGCRYDPMPAGSVCTPPNACVVGAACDAFGTCAGTQRDCDDANPCTGDWCDTDSGCVHDPNSDGSWCDDGNPCTAPDQCQGGQCTNQFLEDGTACDDDNPCTGASICTSGVCSGGMPIGDGGACDDGDPCTEGSVCSEGTCAAGTQVVCPDDGNACTDDACVPGEGCAYGAAPLGTACEVPNPVPCVAAYACEGRECLPNGNVPNGTLCEDETPCTGGSTCQNGYCSVGTPLGDGAACNDGNPCSEGTTCQGGACLGGAEVTCGEQTLCSNAWCDPSRGGCVVDPAGEGLGCDDGDPCTSNDVCRSGVCEGNAFCDDGDACTEDTCSGELCVYEWQPSAACPHETSCGDGTDNNGDGLVDCAVAYCARMNSVCTAEQPFPTKVTFDDGFAPGFGTVYDPTHSAHPRWQIDGTPATPAAFSGAKSLNFNDGVQAGWSDALEIPEMTASLCCWQNDYGFAPVFVTWMEYVDLPTEEETAASDVWIRRGFRFVRDDGGVGTQAELPTRNGDRGRWRRRIVENPDYSEIGGFGVEWSLSAPNQGFTGGAGWFVDDVEVLLGEWCDNDVDDNGNGDVDCDDALCDTFDTCVESNCVDGIDDNGDGDTDCDDQDCASGPACP